MIWRTAIFLVLILAAGILAIVIGTRLSDETMMTLVGVMCGIVASIPVSIGLLIILTRGGGARSENYQDEPPAPSARSQSHMEIALMDARIRQYILGTGTVPENTSIQVWREYANGQEWVCWNHSESRQIHYAPLRLITDGE